jgi:hypothetical protein
MGETCEHCRRILSCKKALRRHQKTSRKCLVAQGKRAPEEPMKPCPACNKTFSSRRAWKEHFLLCPLLELKSRLDTAHAQELKSVQVSHAKELQQLREEHIHMEEKVELLKGLCEKNASAPTNISNVTNINLKDLNDLEDFQILGRLTREDFWEGQRGMADVVLRASLEDDLRWHHTRDENRGKVEVNVGGKKMRDDSFTKIIEKVPGPQIRDINKIADAELKRKCVVAVNGGLDVKKRQLDCLNFKDGARNKDFILAMRRREG